jgi:hypothetical protein
MPPKPVAPKPVVKQLTLEDISKKKFDPGSGARMHIAKYDSPKSIRDKLAIAPAHIRRNN